MSRYPKAEWVPWKYRSPDGVPTYYNGINKPIAVVLHIAEGWQRTARDWANAGHNRASRHFSIGRAGEVLQHLELTDGGYHAGISIAQGLATPPIWPLWKGARVNVNHYTIGIEHEGFHNEPWPAAQRASSRDLCTWLASALAIPDPRTDPMVVGALAPGDRYLLHYPPHAAIDRINRVNDFAPIPQRAAFYDWLKQQGDDMTPEEKAMLTELWRRTGGDKGRDFDLLKLVDNQNTALTRHIEEHPGGDGLPEHDHNLPDKTGGVIR